VASALAWWFSFATSPAGSVLAGALGALLFIAAGVPPRMRGAFVCTLRGRHRLVELTAVGVLWPGHRPHSICLCTRCGRRWSGRGADFARALATGWP
jgi:hypothetical protein